jgi:hypothetical protein
MKYTIPIRYAELNGFGCHILCDAMAEGFKMNMIVDTGASMTVFDINRLKKINPYQELIASEQSFTGVGGEKLNPYTTTIKKLQMGELLLKDIKILATDLSHIIDVYAGLDLDRVDGVLGNDLLRSLKARIDYSKMHLELEK